MDNQIIRCTVKDLTLFPGKTITPRWKLDMVEVSTTKGKFMACLYQLPEFTKLKQDGKTVSLKVSKCYYPSKLDMVKAVASK